MGYYTQYKLTILDNPSHELYEQVVSLIEKKSEYAYLFEDAIKWYDYREDMIWVSKQIPNLTLELTGYGEEAGDSWVEYYQNGKRYRSEFQKPPFNKDLLK